jgi:hypothetical protein
MISFRVHSEPLIRTPADLAAARAADPGDSQGRLEITQNKAGAAL